MAGTPKSKHRFVESEQSILIDAHEFSSAISSFVNIARIRTSRVSRHPSSGRKLDAFLFAYN